MDKESRDDEQHRNTEIIVCAMSIDVTAKRDMEIQIFEEKKMACHN